MKIQTIKDFFSVVEIRTKLVSVTTLFTALLYVWWRQGFPSLVPLLLMWSASLAVDMGTTGFNNYFDFLRGTDRYRDISEPDKIVARGIVSPHFAFWASFWCFASAVVLGFFVALVSTFWIIPLGVLCMLAGFLYTGGPFPISRTPVSELFAGGFLGLILFLIALRVWGLHPDSDSLVVALPASLWIAAILMVNNTCDREGDIEAGRNTLAILLGVKAGEAFVIMYGLAGFGIAFFASIKGILPRTNLITLPFSFIFVVFQWIAMHKKGYSHATKGPNMGHILNILVVSTLGIVIGLALDLFLR